MTFQDSVSSALSKYATFSGRATRSEYWWFALFVCLAQIVAAIIGNGILNTPVLGGLVALGLSIPQLAISARRLHDIDKAGWWQLIVFVPLIGWIVYLIWMCTKGSVGENRFGFPPET